MACRRPWSDPLVAEGKTSGKDPADRSFDVFCEAFRYLCHGFSEMRVRRHSVQRSERTVDGNNAELAVSDGKSKKGRNPGGYNKLFRLASSKLQSVRQAVEQWFITTFWASGREQAYGHYNLTMPFPPEKGRCRKERLNQSPTTSQEKLQISTLRSHYLRCFP
jgi:hypothetical protein